MKDPHGNDHVDGDASAPLAVESTAFVRREPREKTESSTFTTKRVLAAAGLSLVAAGCGAVAYHESVAHASLDVAPVTLEASQVGSMDTLLSRAPFQLRNIEKNLCMDDGGGTANGETKFVLAPCDPASPNQVFRYMPDTKQLVSVAKRNMCVDDGGGSANGETKFHLWECSPVNLNQRFEYLPDTQQFKSATKNKCLDDGGGQSPGETQFHLWDCFPPRDQNLLNQRFQVVPTGPSPSVGPNGMLLLQSRQEIVLAPANRPGMCVDDGGARFNGQTDFRTAPCNPNVDSQVFIYDPATMVFRSARKPSLCLDDGGGSAPGSTQFHLWECDPGLFRNQRFVYDPATLRLRNAMKGLCMDGSNGIYTLQICKDGPNQVFSISRPLSGAGPTPPMPPLPPTPPIPLPPTRGMELLLARQPVLLGLAGRPGMCVDDGGARFSGQTDFRMAPCDSSRDSQVFIFDPANAMFRSARKPSLCLDDGGDSPGVTRFHLWDCDPTQRNQKFMYDVVGQRLRNPAKGLCMDYTTGAFTVRPCVGSPVQAFQIMRA